MQGGRERDNKNSDPPVAVDRSRDGAQWMILPPSIVPEVVFEPGEQHKVLSVSLVPTNNDWSPTRWFHLVASPVSGDAILGGPHIAAAHEQSRHVRVFILQELAPAAPGDIRSRVCGAGRAA